MRLNSIYAKSGEAQLKELVVPTIALTSQFSRAEQLLGKDTNPMSWVFLAEAYDRMNKPREVHLSLAKLRANQHLSDIARLRSIQLLVKVGEADEASRIIKTAPLPWMMQVDTARRFAARGFPVQAAKLARSISQNNGRIQALADTASVLATQGQRSVALKLAQEAEELLTPTSEQSNAAAVVRALTLAGDVPRAERLLDTWPSSLQATTKLKTALVKTIAEQGDIAGALRRLSTVPTLTELYALMGAADARLSKGSESQARELLDAVQKQIPQLPANQQAELQIQLQRAMARLLPEMLKAVPGTIRPEVLLSALGTYGRRGQPEKAQWILERFSPAEQRFALLPLASGLKDGGHADLLLPWLSDAGKREVAAEFLLNE